MIYQFEVATLHIGDLLSHGRQMTDNRAHATLRRIADALGMAPTDFFDPGTSCSAGSAALAAQEAAELLESFAQITDPTIRRACLDFVRAKKPGQPNQRA